MKTDTQLQRDVMDELEFEPSVDASNIGVSAKDGIVTLTGKVGNYAEKYAASEAAEPSGMSMTNSRSRPEGAEIITFYGSF
jgi:osmotically-inducible protein OsmY